MPAISGLDHIALTVTDLDASCDFYENVVGLQPSGSLEDGPFVRRLFALPGGLHLGLTQHDSGSGLPFDPTTPGLDHVALACTTREELVAWEAHLAERGVSHSGVQDAAYGSALSFRDPDDIALELFVPAGG